MSPLSRRLLIAFAGLGLAASSVATYVHYNLIRNPDYSSFCDINATVSCKAAYLSRYGSIAGIPVAVGGVVFFAWVLLMLWGSRGRSATKESAPAYIFAGSTVALAVVLYLAYASFFVLKEVCPLCVATYIAVIGVFVISGGTASLPLSSLPGRLGRDVRVMVTTPSSLIVALLFIAGALWVVTSFPRAAERPVVADAPPLASDQRSELERWWTLQPASANFPYSNDGAKVLIVEFADFQCPHCRQMYFAYKPIVDKYLSEHPQDVKFLFKTWPLSSGCNSSVPGVHFSATCEASAAFVMAHGRGTADSLKDWFFLHQEELNPATVRRAAAEIGKIPDFDAQYPQAIQTVKADASAGTALKVNSTPSFFVNGKRVPEGGLPPQYFDALIDLELKRATR
jgi:uncharacterized membrane protein